MCTCRNLIRYHRDLVIPHKLFKFHSLVGRSSLYASFPVGPRLDERLVGGYYLCHPKRFFSKSTYQWISRLRFGTDEGIFFGASLDATGETTQLTRKLYCCALVYASGGSTMARDWIAGCSALLTADDVLFSIALQYVARADDMTIFRNHILEQLLQEKMKADTDTLIEQPNSVPVVNPEVPWSSEAKAGDQISNEHLYSVENYVLQASPIVRCFLYDAMTASLFKCRGELSILEETRERLLGLNAQYFGVPLEDIMAIWRLVEAEFILKGEKNQILGQPWDD